MFDSKAVSIDQMRAPHATLVWLSALFLIMSFLPYVAIPLGNSTNVSVASIVGGLLTIRILRNPRMLIVGLLAFTAPFAATLIRVVTGSGDINVNAYFTYAFMLFTFLGAASAVEILRARCVPILSSCISISAIAAIVQKYAFLNNGVIPLIELYDVPGYASVASNAETIAKYIRRPFGLFPEPSFLAGSLALACGLLVLLVAAFKFAFTPGVAASLGLAVFTIYISDSGSGVICIALLGFAVFLPYIRKHSGLILLLPIVMTGAIWLGLSIAANRQDGVNTSWNDRLASIIGGINLWLEDPVNFLVGVGRGMVPVYFRQGDVEYTGMSVYSTIPDIYSVLVRFIVENGAIFGLPLILWMFVLILRTGGSRVSLLGIVLGALWLVVAGLTISYETAAWIWLLPGASAALLFSQSIVAKNQHGALYEDTSRR